MRFMITVLLGLLISPAAHAVITFTQLGDDLFVVSHRVKFIGSRGQAMKLVYEKAASLCEAAGYSYMRILDQESEASQEDDSANASVRIKLSFEPNDDTIDCRKNASSEYVEEAAAKLAKQGYRLPETPSPALAGAVVAPAVASAVATGGAGGRDCDDAVVMAQTTTHDGIEAELAWLAARYPEWTRTGQSLAACGERTVDIVTIRSPGGATAEVYFDISSFYGKW